MKREKSNKKKKTCKELGLKSLFDRGLLLRDKYNRNDMKQITFYSYSTPSPPPPTDPIKSFDL